MLARPKVLFLVEGNTDIRFVIGLSEISTLTMAVPAVTYDASDLRKRIIENGTSLSVVEIPGNRLHYQISSFLYLLRHAREYDIILSQEVLRGSLSATIVGALRRIPVITFMCIAPVEYFRCRRERKQVGWWKAIAGEATIRSLMWVNGKLATRCVALGPYLVEIAAKYCSSTTQGFYYGVDTSLYRPVDEEEKARIRVRLDLPLDAFIVFLSSRISHEKDPETVLKAVAICRSRGCNATVVNLGGGYQDFLDLAREVAGPDMDKWVLARPAAHPMKELAQYYQAADCLAQASLAEGLGLSPLEAMACGTPAVCTAVGGLAANLGGYARLTPRRDPEAMARELLWIFENRQAARAQALAGRDFVIREWGRQKAFGALAGTFQGIHRLPGETRIR
jgi:glycosyltransferase involved in cell wall biosynthesis